MYFYYVWKFLPFKKFSQTDHPSNQWTDMRDHREVTLPRISTWNRDLTNIFFCRATVKKCFLFFSLRVFNYAWVKWIDFLFLWDNPKFITLQYSMLLRLHKTKYISIIFIKMPAYSPKLCPHFRSRKFAIFVSILSYPGHQISPV